MINFEFTNPEFLWLLLFLPLLGIWFFINRKKDQATLKISNIQAFKDYKSILPKLKPILYVVRLIALALLIISLARPRKVSVSKRKKT